VGFKLDFHTYYFCLMAGLVTGRKADASQSDAVDIIDYFPGDYSEKGRLIVAAFLVAELRDLGVKMSDRAAVRSAIGRLVSPSSQSYLTDAGTREMNRYAYGGFDVLTEWFDAQPLSLETFLPLFKQYLDVSVGHHEMSAAP